ncbi:hypothetical protein [Nitrospira sp. ND1]|uniref:hypothetical protein n=1 Tax=Nitrospira sp. ND1 TaxID=1658518 RepID=UPI0009BAF921|nr:hypothetical protein [Nitrospira sp. ND1]
MCAQWKKGYDPAVPLAWFEKEKRTNAAGHVEFPGHWFEDYMQLLISSVEFSSELPEEIAHGITQQGVMAAAKANKLNSKWLISHISAREHEYTQKPAEKFFMAGSISIRSRKRLPQIKVSGHVIRFGQDVPMKVLEKELQYKTIFMQAITREFPRDYLRCIVSTAGKSETEAGWSALDALDCSRALWNLSLNSKKMLRMSSGTISPVNQIVLGSLQTLFKADLDIIDHKWWHDPNYQEPIRAYDVTENWDKLRKYEKKAMAKMKSSSCEAFIVRGLLRYVRALDGRDYESIFLKLWSVLEHLTQTSKENSDVTIRRAVFLWKDNTFHRQVLYHLKESRNSSVHQDEFGGRGETLVYQLKRYVEALLEFLIFEGYKFPSIEQIKAFLDLPLDRESLVARKRLILKALRFRSS